MAFDRSNPHETHYKAKLALRWIGLLSSIIGIATAGYAWIFAVFLLLPLCLVFIMDLVNIIHRMRNAFPVHPGVNVAFDLIIWLLFSGILIFTYVIAGAGLAFTKNGTFVTSWYSTGSTSSTVVYSNNGNGDTVTCTGDCSSVSGRDTTTATIDVSGIRTRAGVALAACVFATIAFVVHFVLFIFACVDTHRRRHPERYPEYSRDAEKPAHGAYTYPSAYPSQPSSGAYQQGAPNGAFR